MGPPYSTHSASTFFALRVSCTWLTGELCIWGVKLRIEEKLTKAERSVMLKLDLKNAHNTFSRPKPMAALKKVALSSEKNATCSRMACDGVPEEPYLHPRPVGD